ncbi:hypothetical protein [Nocardia sp. NPDC048505]|uniref:hypothetical protein n=1 Tax=unclassified Nocardia TaxID=2637762 RepID=UPI00340AB0B0
MMKSFAAGLLVAATSAVLIAVPAGSAAATSPTCDKAIQLINAAVDMSGGNLDAATREALSGRLSALAALTSGEESAVIAGYANALIDDSVTDLDPATNELNRVCA